MRRVLVGLLVLLLAATLAPATAHATSPIAVPGGLTPDGKVLRVDSDGELTKVAAVGDCEQADVYCKPDRSGSCTGNTNQVTSPSSIRVLTGSTASSIKTVPFQQYVADVLPNEWFASWDGDALKAGAVAVKSYAWYWVTHYGGYVGSPSSSTCFDVTDDPDFQVYKAGTGSMNTRIQSVVQQSWPVAVRRDGRIVQTYYRSYLTAAGEDEACGAGADGTTMSQFGTQACNEVNKANNGYRYNVILKLYYGNDIDLTTTAQLRTQHDFTFVGRSTGGSYTNGQWYIADGYPTTFTYGLRGDVGFVATDGDGFALPAVFRPSTRDFWVADPLHKTTSRRVHFGVTGDVPVAAHYEGLASPTQLAVYRPSNSTWYFANAAGVVGRSSVWGIRGDTPLPGRWLDASKDSLAVFRPSNNTWYVQGSAAVRYAVKGDVPIPADYNGDGKTDIAVYRPSDNTFWVRGSAAVKYGIRGDVAVTGDFTGDGRADIAIYRPSNGTLWVRGGAINQYVGKGTPIGATPYRN